MAIIIGMGDFVYEYQADWAQWPEGTSFQRPSAVAVDSNDRVSFREAGHRFKCSTVTGNSWQLGPARETALRTPITSTSGPMMGCTWLTGTLTRS